MATQELLNYKCPNCGAPLVFDSAKQKLVCHSCDNEFTEEQVQSYQKNMEDAEAPSKIDWSKAEHKSHEQLEAKGYVCQSCGAEIVADENTAATECMYCGNPTIIPQQVSGMLTPDFVIPFQVDKKVAKEALKTFCGKKKRLLPNLFLSENHIEKITGMYVPFWLFDCAGSGRATFHAEKVRMWSDSENDYVETRHYSVSRAGALTFDKIPVDASSQMDDAYMDAIEPYDYKEMKEFAPLYLSGYFADKFDVDAEQSMDRASERVKNSTEEALRETVTGYDSVLTKGCHLEMEGKEIHYALLPVWMLNTKYAGKMYQFAINGQSGKIVGALPISKAKCRAWFWGLSVGLATIATVIHAVIGMF